MSSVNYRQVNAPAMSDKDLRNRIAADEAKVDALNDGFIQYVERSLLIAIGVSVTVIAAFLSQVWGTAGVPFRTELAELLKRAGELFVFALPLPGVSHLAKTSIEGGRWVSVFLLVVWLGVALVVFGRFVYLLNDAGAIVLKFAKLPVT